MKTLYWILGGLGAATIIGVVIYKNMPGTGKPSLEGYDAINKTVSYKINGQKRSLKLKDGETAQVGPYLIRAKTIKANVAGMNIGDVYGAEIVKNGEIIEELEQYLGG